jgi:hypothetical protein
MYFEPFRDAMRPTAAWAAALATIAVLNIPPVHAGEVRTIDCIRTFSEGQRFDYRSGYDSNHGDGYGNSYSSGFNGDDRRRSNGGITRGFRDGAGQLFVGGTRNGLYGGSIQGSETGASSGYDNGYSSGYGTSSAGGSGSESCVEIRHELINPYVIHVPPTQSTEDSTATNERERLWRARCRPVVTQDKYGVSRYAYSAPGCDYGKTE